MAGSKPEVTLTFAGDSTKLEKTFGSVGQAADKLGKDVGQAGQGFDRAREGFDELDTKAMGFRDTITGVQDSVTGFSSILKGDFSAEALFTAGAGVGDLASGFSNLLVPAMKSGVEWLKATKVATVAQTIASNALKVGTLIWAGAQWVLNAAFIASPIGWIVIGIGLLVAAIVLIATKTTWFQDIWRVAWDWIKKAASNVWDWITSLPDKLGEAFSKIAGFITAPFRAAFNFVSDAWNNTIGKLSWSVPGWVPFIGGNTIAAPLLPKFHAGVGRVPGPIGSEVLAMVQAGETIGATSSSGTTVLELRSSGRDVDNLLVKILSRAIKDRGGIVQVAVGR